MDFNFRQYDPQLGRFNAVDPLAGSTDMVSPYAAMGNAPESLTDPTGLRAGDGPSPKFCTSSPMANMVDYSIDEGYAAMLRINAELVRSGMDPIGGFGEGFGGGGGGWSGGGSSGQVFYLEGAAAQAFWKAFVGGATITFFNGTNSFVVNYPGGGASGGGGSSGWRRSTSVFNVGILASIFGYFSDLADDPSDGGVKMTYGHYHLPDKLKIILLMDILVKLG